MTASRSGAFVTADKASVFSGTPEIATMIVRVGANRRFYVVQFGYDNYLNLDSMWAAVPTLQGPKGATAIQTTSGFDRYSNNDGGADDLAGTIFWWDEDKLKAAGCPIGDEANVIITSPGTYTPGSGPQWSEEAWGYFTIKDVDNTKTPQSSGSSVASTSINIPNTAFPSEPAELTKYQWFLSQMTPNGAVTITNDAGYTLVAADEYVGTNFIVRWADGEFVNDVQETVTLSGTPNSSSFMVQQVYSHAQPSQGASASAVTLGKRPGMRSISAKTLADRYNKGQPLMPDYTFPGGRKFYQDPPDTP